MNKSSPHLDLGYSKGRLNPYQVAAIFDLPPIQNNDNQNEAYRSKKSDSLINNIRNAVVVLKVTNFIKDHFFIM